MASLKKDKKTPYWVLRYRDLDTGKWRDKSTGLRWDNPTETRRAQKIAEAATKQEAQVSSQVSGNFSLWVQDYINAHYSNPNSKSRYSMAWDRILEFMKLRRIKHPREVRYEHANDFLEWRKQSGVKHNSARLELKFFSFLMQEALRREYAEKNPIALQTVPRQVPQAKKDLSLEDLDIARDAFKTAPSWMMNVFEICAHLGCRFNEAEISKEDVDFDKGVIWITDSKRKVDDPRKRFSVPLPSTLSDHLKKVFEKSDKTVERLTRDRNRCFNKFLTKAFGEKVTSHCFRVSFITRCHRAGISENKAMRLVNHSNQLVHRIYSKLTADDLFVDAKLIPPPFAPKKT
jgi:integrase